MENLITVVVAAYNVEEEITSCLTSIINQTYRNIEIIIVDDGSIDQTENICQNFLKKHRNIKYFKQVNSGVSVARNVGISKSNGDFICFVDGDDQLEPEMIASLASAANSNTDISICCCNAFDKDNSYNDYFFKESFIAKTMNEKENLFLQLMDPGYGKIKTTTAVGVPWGKLYRVSLLKNNHILFDPELRRMQDNIFNMSAFFYAKEITYINKPLYRYRLSHIQGVRFKYTPENWYHVISCRNDFWNSHQKFVSKNIKKGIIIERNTALAASIAYLVNKNKNCVNDIKTVKRYPLYADMINKPLLPIRPVKFLGLRILLHFNMYNSIIKHIGQHLEGAK